MIILDTTTRSLEVDLTGAVTTNELPFVASYVDINQSTFAMTGASTNTGTSNGTTAVTLVAAPGATTSRQLKYLSIKNSDTVATELWVQVNDNATLREIWKGTLAVGDTLVYVDSTGFVVINSSGQIKTAVDYSGNVVNTAAPSVGWYSPSADLIRTPNDVTIDGQLIVSGTGPHAIGGATSANVLLSLAGAFTGSAETLGIRMLSSLTGIANTDIVGFLLRPLLIEAGSGTHGLISGLHVVPQNITDGSATATLVCGISAFEFAAATGTTNASTVYIRAATTGATNNYALWVDAGSVRIDGTDGAGTSAGTLANAPSAGDPDKWIPINSDGTQYWIPAWAA